MSFCLYMQSLCCKIKTTNTALKTHQGAFTPSMFKWDTTWQLVVCSLAGSDIWWANWTERAQKHPPISLYSSYPNTAQPLLTGNEKQMVPSISFYEMRK